MILPGPWPPVRVTSCALALGGQGIAGTEPGLRLRPGRPAGGVETASLFSRGLQVGPRLWPSGLGRVGCAPGVPLVGPALTWPEPLEPLRSHNEWPRSCRGQDSAGTAIELVGRVRFPGPRPQVRVRALACVRAEGQGRAGTAWGRPSMGAGSPAMWGAPVHSEGFARLLSRPSGRAGCVALAGCLCSWPAFALTARG